MYRVVLCFIVLYYTVMYRVVVCFIVLYRIALYIVSCYNTVGVVLRCVHDWTNIGLCCIVFHCTVLCCAAIMTEPVLDCVVLCSIVLYCVVPCPWLTQSGLVVDRDDGVLKVWRRVVLYCILTDLEWTCRPRWWCTAMHCVVLCCVVLCCVGVPCPWLTHSGLVVDEDDGVHKVWRRVVQDAVHCPQQHWPSLVVEHSHHTERGQPVRVLTLLTPVTEHPCYQSPRSGNVTPVLSVTTVRVLTLLTPVT